MDAQALRKTEPTAKEGKKLNEKKKDRGDTHKKQDETKNGFNDAAGLKVAHKPNLPDRGDVPVTNRITKTQTKLNFNIKTDKMKANEKDRKLLEFRPKLFDGSPTVNTEAEKVSNIKTSEICSAEVNKTKLGERNLSDKINLRPRIANRNRDFNKNVMKSDLRTDRFKSQPNPESGSKQLILDSARQATTKKDPDVNKKDKESTVHRKPLIKTVKSKNDNRVYKAVTFTEQKRVQPTILEISIPNIQVKKINNKVIDKNVDANPDIQMTNNKSASKLSVKENLQRHHRNRITERSKRKKLNRCISSPDKFKKVESPPTEVAKWAPSCLNTHTKPYYEAWVNTTLAAISKISKKDKLFLEKQNIIKTFQKSLEFRAESTELIHEDYIDECYTGRIKIKQNNLSKKSRQPQITPLL